MSQLRESPKFQHAKFTFKSVNKSRLYDSENEAELQLEQNLKEGEKLELIEQISLKQNDGFLQLDFCVTFEYLLEERERVVQVLAPMFYAFPLDYDF